MLLLGCIVTGFTRQPLLSDGMTHPLNWGHCASLDLAQGETFCIVELPSPICSQFQFEKRPAFWRKNGGPEARESGK